MSGTTIKNREKSDISQSWLYDALVSNYYQSYYDVISSKELDKDFSKQLNNLSNSLSKLNKQEKIEMVAIMSKLISFYLEHKINKELEDSFEIILKF